MAAAFLFCSAPAHAAAEIDVEQGLQECSEIAGRVERLICYDDLAQQLGFLAAEKVDREENILGKYGFWEVTKKKNATGEEIYYLKNDAAEEVTLQSGLKRIPTFIITCKHGRTDAYLDWKSRLNDSYLSIYSKLPVNYQFDSGERRQSGWELSTDRQAAFVPDAVEFIKEMRHHEQMFLFFTPMHESTQTVVHDITGLDNVLQILVDKCYN